MAHLKGTRSVQSRFCEIHKHVLSSPREARRLKAESARAFTGRQCPHSGVGEDFLALQLFFFFYKNGRNSETKCQKIDPKVAPGGLQTGLMQFGVVWPKKMLLGQM